MKRLAPIAAALLSLLFYLVVLAQNIEGTVNKGANLRAGPGTTYAIVGKAAQGQAVTIADKNTAGDWYQLDSGEWIAAFLVTLDAAPVATKTPSATATPTIQVTTADILSDPVAQAYVVGVTDALDLYSTGATIISDRFTEAGAKPSVIFTDKWKLAVGVGLASLQMSSESIHELEPPTYFSDIHDDLLAMSEHTDNSIVFIVEGIDEFDADKIRAGTGEINLAAEFITSANSKLDVLKAAAAATPAPTPTKSAATSTPTKPAATPTRPPTATPLPASTATTAPAQENCDPSYPDVCIPPAPPDLNCSDIEHRKFRVLPPDPHGFDGNDNDGLGCESN